VSVFNLNKRDFTPDQLDVLRRVFERAWSSYVIEQPVIDEEWATLREQLASAVFDTARRAREGIRNNEKSIEKLKRLALIQFLSQTRFGATPAYSPVPYKPKAGTVPNPGSA
jgi:hypothetical protein